MKRSATAGFRQVLVERQVARNGSTYLRYLQRVGKPSHIVIAFGVDEDLCLVLETAERFRMDNSVPIALKGCPIGIVKFGETTSP